MANGRKKLFSSQSIELVQTGDATDANLCITFSPFDPSHVPTRAYAGFSEAYLRERSIPGLHFIAKANHWWQVDEMSDCIAAASEVAQQAKRRIGYGSSMGAFGCLRHSDALKLDTILAFAPQYSVDPVKVPWEMRWKQDREAITRFDDRLQAHQCKDILVFFDPAGPDTRHIAQIENELAIKKVLVPGGGHFVMKFLATHGLLGVLVERLIRGEIDHGELQSLTAALADTQQA